MDYAVTQVECRRCDALTGKAILAFVYTVLYRNLYANVLSNFLSRLLFGFIKKKIENL